MKFPKHELNVGVYLNEIKSLLCDESCHIFIDTNIISQLYRLNDKAREDFYNWVASCGDRFHVPVWAVHEYSNRVNSQNTKDYLSELSKIKTYSKELNNISEFIKGYVGDYMLEGSSYQGKREELFRDIDSVNNLLSKISPAINNKIQNHLSNVHKEIIEKLESRSLSSNIYEIMRNVQYEYDVRFTGKVPPGFKDSNKEQNAHGDLIIWQEIISYCKACSSAAEHVKAILISRDNKPDMVYCPNKQTNDGRDASNSEKLVIAHESLAYEFKTKTGSECFYLINFNSLVKILAAEYRELAKSFQIATAEEQIHNANEIDCDSDDMQETENNVPLSNISSENTFTQQVSHAPNVGDLSADTENVKDDIPYLGVALIDSQYDYNNSGGSVDEYIEKLKSYNWYEQNPAINRLMNLKTTTIENNITNRSSFFVLGRNILQSAEGSSGSAISFIENLYHYTSAWNEVFQRALIDGCLYEVFFNSEGNVRPKNFKATYFFDLERNVKSMSLTNPFDFINTELDRKKKTRFAPEIGSGKNYSFKFEFDDNQNTTSVKCNDVDISSTFHQTFYEQDFASVDNIEITLSYFYAIPKEYIRVEPPLPRSVKSIRFIQEPLPF